MTRCDIEHCRVKISNIAKLASLVISSVTIQTAVAGHDVGIGVGPTFGSGISGGILQVLFATRFHPAPASGGDAHERVPGRHSATGKHLEIARNNRRIAPTDKASR
jgi:hypothetical protein